MPPNRGDFHAIERSMTPDNEEGREPIDIEVGMAALQTGAPAAPVERGGPPTEHPHRELWMNVRRALYAVPTFFKTKVTIAGVKATDIHSLNSSLGASIEQSVVEQLNLMRDVWDPVDAQGARRYQHLAFKRQSTTWPDVLLTSGLPGEAPVMGIELKGWFVLAKEGEPSFRYKVNPNVCTDLDLLAVFPWNLDEVLSGSPFLMKPFIVEARWAAEMRNHYWRYGRRGEGNRDINDAVDQDPYPSGGKKFSDEPVSDSGKNFGRASRTGIMNDFIAATFEETAAGIPLAAWNEFLRTFREGEDLAELASTIRVRRATLKPENDSNCDFAHFLRNTLAYIDMLRGTDTPDLTTQIAGDKIIVRMAVDAAEFESALVAAKDKIEMIGIKAGSFSIIAAIEVEVYKKRLAIFKKKTDPLDRLAIDLDLGHDGVFKVKNIKRE